MDKIDLYTDGSCKSGAGGWAIRLITTHEGKVVTKDAQGEIYGVATSQRAEMIAIIAGLDMLKRRCNVRIYTDCEPLIKIASQLTSRRDMNIKIPDEDLWGRIEKEMMRHSIQWFHVKAHSKYRQNPHNASCDVRAGQMSERARLRMHKKERLNGRNTVRGE